MGFSCYLQASHADNHVDHKMWTRSSYFVPKVPLCICSHDRFDSVMGDFAIDGQIKQLLGLLRTQVPCLPPASTVCPHRRFACNVQFDLQGTASLWFTRSSAIQSSASSTNACPDESIRLTAFPHGFHRLGRACLQHARNMP